MTSLASSVQTKAKMAIIYQIKMTLEGVKPPIWRRVQVSAQSTLSQLHEVIQASMGWWNYHLHSFRIEGEEYTRHSEDGSTDELDMREEQRVKLQQVLGRKGQRFSYTYDFGDNWEHRLVLEEIMPADPSRSYPVCLAGQRACPPEDCGGVYGYENVLEALRDPEHEEHQQIRTWIGRPFDPEAFSLPAVNEALQQSQRKRRQPAFPPDRSLYQ